MWSQPQHGLSKTRRVCNRKIHLITEIPSNLTSGMQGQEHYQGNMQLPAWVLKPAHSYCRRTAGLMPNPGGCKVQSLSVFLLVLQSNHSSDPAKSLLGSLWGECERQACYKQVLSPHRAQLITSSWGKHNKEFPSQTLLLKTEAVIDWPDESLCRLPRLILTKAVNLFSTAHTSPHTHFISSLSWFSDQELVKPSNQMFYGLLHLIMCNWKLNDNIF